MADKKLLEESTIRRFMELANIKPTQSRMLSESMAGGRTAIPDQVTHRPVVEEEDAEENMKEGYGQGEGMYEEADEEGGEEGGMDALPAGDETGAGMEGGDLESAVEQLVSAMNGVLSAAGMGDKAVELDSGEGDESEAGAEDEMGGEVEEEAPMMERKKKKVQEEELEEAIELVDENLIDKLLQRVSARLVSEARRSRELAEGKAGGWGKKGMHANSKASKSSTAGHKAGKGTPFTKSVSVKGTAGRK